MLDFKFVKDEKTHKEWIETSITGKLLLTTTQLNKGTAFTEQERREFNLIGKLPAQVETLDEQVKRAYFQFSKYHTPLQKNIYLYNLHDKNQVLFYKLVSEHLTEMLPFVYTPIIGTAVKEYSREFRQARGLYIAYNYRDQIEEILDNRSHPEIDIIVVTDGEGVLGIGDQGIGAMDISIGKLMVYTLCAGVNPLRTLPIMLDVGTNNQDLLNDPLYLGLRHPRIDGKEYNNFIDKFVKAVKKKFPRAFLHWEDFGNKHARHILNKYRQDVCSFNDDIQGTGVVTLAALLAAAKVTQKNITEQQIIIFGAGNAGTGIADQIHHAMVHEGLSSDIARKQFWLIDKDGLLLKTNPNLTAAQIPYARDPQDISTWKIKANAPIDLETVVKNLKPTALVGCSSQSGAFKQNIIEEMAKHTTRPIIFSLSNPTENAEATPQDLLNWTQGKALIATGSPFAPVTYQQRTYSVAQCNNALAFPGIGLGITAVQATHLSDEMLWVACKTLAESAPVLHDANAPILPLMEDAYTAAQKIALAVAKQAQAEGLATIMNPNVENLIDAITWYPHYLPLIKK